MKETTMLRKIIAIALIGLSSTATNLRAENVEILNVSYDIARELYAKINPVFIAKWQAETGQILSVRQSHAGSSKQARAILQGLQADLVTFNQVLDVQVLADKGGFVSNSWQADLPNNASPYYSLPAFLVRGGNPKGIKDWDDLARDDVSLVFPNPKTSGNGRYTYLSAYAFALNKNGGDHKAAEEFLRKILKNVAVFDTGGRGATTTFVEREIGDVLITFEAEVENIRAKEADGAYDRVVPSISILAEFPVALVEKIAKSRGTEQVSKAYLDFLYSKEGQEIIVSFNNRVNHPEVVKANADNFPQVKLFTVEDVFGSWPDANKTHFATDGVFDRLQRR